MSNPSQKRNKQQFIGFYSTPSLLKGFEYVDFILPEIESDLELAIPDNLMLGKRVERFFSEIIEQSPETKLLFENVQIIEDGVTKGELDFGIENPYGKNIHVEVVYKFYLFDDSIEGQEEDKWIGPNRNDFLAKKIDKLRDQQFPLLFDPLIKQEHKIDKSWGQQLCFKAQLFLPFGFGKMNLVAVNKDCIAGLWFKMGDFMKYFREKNVQVHIPEKQDWLAVPYLEVEWDNYQSAVAQILTNLDHQKSPLIWVRMAEDRILKAFVVWW